MFCPHCREELREHSTNCPSCGKKVAIIQAQRLKRFHLTLKEIAGLIVAITGLIVALLGMSEKLWKKHPPPVGTWLVKLSASTTFNPKNKLAEEARNHEYHLVVYFKDGWYVQTISTTYPTKEEASRVCGEVNRVLPSLSREQDSNKKAYPENRDTWCPKFREDGPFRSCE